MLSFPKFLAVALSENTSNIRGGSYTGLKTNMWVEVQSVKINNLNRVFHTFTHSGSQIVNLIAFL